MDLNLMNDVDLITKIDTLVRDEREILINVLHVLQEIGRRRLYSTLGYKSLFDFAVRRLGYPEDQAYRRISAMKLIRELPEIKEKVTSGDISLTHIGLAQTLFRGEKKLEKEMSSNQKLEVLEAMAKKSVRDAEQITHLFSSTPEVIRPDQVRSNSQNHVELKFSAPKEIENKIERLRGYLAHKFPGISLGQLFDQLCDLGLEEFRPLSTKSAASRKRCVIKPKSQAQVNREVYERAKNACENCGSTYALEVDHIDPRAKGGSSGLENLRLFCRSCNQRAAIDEFGQQKMDAYINGK